MTDEIPQAAKDYARKLIEEAKRLPHIVFAEEYVISRLAHENGLVPKEVDVLATLLGDIGIALYPAAQVHADNIRTELAKHGYAIVKVATDEERLIEARELCAMVAEEFGGEVFVQCYIEGSYDEHPEMIATLAALRARDGVA